MASSVSPDLYRKERTRHGKFTCDLCSMQWPMAHLRVHKGGDRVGVVCCYEPDGDGVARDLRRAHAEAWAAHRSAEELVPPKAPNGMIYSGATDLIDTDAAIVEFTPTPIVMTHGGAAVVVTVTGVNFTDADVFTYPSGITDSVAPVRTGSTQWVLTVVASGGVQARQYPLIFGTQLWQAAFDVR